MNKHLICIVSAICTVNTPLSYTDTRSFFTHQQRFEQSIKTIQHVKQKIPNSYIVFIEGTRINDNMISEITNQVDYFFDAFNIDWVNKNVNSPHKSRGEIASILSYIQSDHFITNNNNFTSFSKISGRYMPNKSFNFKLIPDNIYAKISFNPRYHSVEYMSTLFYTIPNSLFDLYVQACKNCYHDENIKNGDPIECILLKHFNLLNIPIYRTNQLNVEGEYGPWGGYVCH